MANIKIAYSPVNGNSICNNLVEGLETFGHTVKFIQWPTDTNPYTGWFDYQMCIADQVDYDDILIGICFGGTLCLGVEMLSTIAKIKKLILINTPVELTKVPCLNALSYIKPESILDNLEPDQLHMLFNGARYMFGHIKKLDLSNPITRWAETSFNMLHRQLIRDLITKCQPGCLTLYINRMVQDKTINIVGQTDTLVPYESSHLFFKHIVYNSGGHLTPFLKPANIVSIVNTIT